MNDEKISVNNKDWIKQAIVGLVVTVLGGLFFVASYGYEVAYLEKSGVPPEVASNVAELDMSTYVSMLSIFGIYLLITLLMMQFAVGSSKISKVFRNGWFRLTMLLVASICSLLSIWMPDTSESWIRALSIVLLVGGIAAAALIVSAILFLREVGVENLIQAGVLIGALMFCVVALQMVPAVISTLASQRALNHEAAPVVIHNETYNLVRQYGARVLLEKDGIFYTMVISGAEVLEYRSGL